MIGFKILSDFSCLSPPVKYFTARAKAKLILWISFVICVSYLLSVPCSLVVICWERADLLSYLHVLFSSLFCHFSI